MNIRTTKFKLGNSAEFDELCGKFLDTCNWLAPIVYSSKQTNSVKLHAEYYTIIKEKFELPSQLICSSFKYVTATFLSQKSKKQWHPTFFKRQVIPIVWKRDFSMTKTKGLCFWGKPINVFDKRLPPVATWKDSKLQKRDNCWYLILCHTVELPEVKTEGCIVGVDSGIKRIFTATNSANSKTFTFSGGTLNHKRRCIRKIRSKVQTKKTKSAKRLLKRMSRHESGITNQLMHTASKQLVQYAEYVGARRIAMENLGDIREVSLAKGKNLRSKVCRWPYSQGQFFVKYKAEAKGIAFELVSPKNTSRGCPLCGHIDSRNRNGLHFRCLLCGYKGDADRVASVNIRNRSVATRHNLVTTGSNNTPGSLEPLEVIASGHVSNDPLAVHLGSLLKPHPSLVVG